MFSGTTTETLINSIYQPKFVRKFLIRKEKNFQKLN